MISEQIRRISLKNSRGRLFEGGDYFKYFHQRGAIIRGKAIIQGNTVVSSLIYISSVIDKVQCLRKKG